MPRQIPLKRARGDGDELVEGRAAFMTPANLRSLILSQTPVNRKLAEQYQLKDINWALKQKKGSKK